MSNSFENITTQIMEKLLSGGIICEYTNEAAYEYLKKDTYRDDIDQLLNRMSRKLMLTVDQSAFYAVYSSICSPERRQDVKAQFRETINSLEPFLRWVKLVMSSLQKEVTIQPGEVIRQGELLSAIEVTEALKEDLAKITAGGVFDTRKAEVKDQLSSVFNELVKRGYLVKQSSTGTAYTATGKWAYLYEVLEFIYTHENLGSEDDLEEQQEFTL
ncbi:MAG: condensin complex protein MksE [Oleiphilus sp.]